MWRETDDEQYTVPLMVSRAMGKSKEEERVSLGVEFFFIRWPGKMTEGRSQASEGGRRAPGRWYSKCKGPEAGPCLSPVLKEQQVTA